MTTIGKEIFQYLGLSKKAQIIYQKILEKGMTTATYLSQELSLPRSTVYFELGSLQTLKLVSIVGGHKKRKFVIESPKRILEIIQDKEKEAQKLSDLAQDFVSGLTKKMKQDYWNIPTINFFQGVKGVQQTIRLTNQAISKKVFGIIPSTTLYEILGENFMKRYTEERLKNKIQIKNIWPEGQVPKELKNHKQQLREVRFSKKILSIPSSIIVFDDKVILITSKRELLSIVIKSKDLSQTIKVLFDIFWNNPK